MPNLTLSLLTSTLSSQSPFLTIKGSCAMYSVVFQHQFSSTAFSSHPNSKISIHGSSFTKYLSNAIRTEAQVYLIGKEYVFTRKSIESEDVVVVNSKFYDFRSNSDYGGAISVANSLSLQNVLFLRCEAPLAGAFLVKGNLKAKFVSIEDCQAANCAAFSAEKAISFTKSSFSTLQATLHCLSQHISEEHLSFAQTNITKCTAKDNTGLLFSISKKVVLSDCIVTHTKCERDHGGFLFRNSLIITIEDTVFCEMSRQDPLPTLASVAIGCQTLRGPIFLTNVLFNNVGSDLSPSIDLQSIYTLQLSGCLFSNTQIKEVNAPDAKLIIEQTKFSAVFNTVEISPDAFRANRGYLSDGMNAPENVYQTSRIASLFALSVVSVAYGAILYFFIPHPH